MESSLELDLSRLSKSKKLQLLKRESPEFLPLVEDLKSETLMTFVNKFVFPNNLFLSQVVCWLLETKLQMEMQYGHAIREGCP